MNDTFHVSLSAGELFVIAALLGYDCVFGVEDDGLLSGETQMKTQIRQTLQQLEHHKLVRYDLEGTLYIQPRLRQAMDCLCSADTVGCFSTNLGSGKTVTVYILEKNALVTTLEDTGKGIYKLHLSDRIAAERVIPQELLRAEALELDEMMLFEEAQYVQAQIEAFNTLEAQKRLETHTKDSHAARLITRILGRSCGYWNFQIHRKGQQLYDAVSNGLFVCVDGHAVSVTVDRNGVLRFEAVSPGGLLSRISPYFNLDPEKGVQ